MRYLPFLLPYPGNGFHRAAQYLLNKANITPLRTVCYRNMETAYQLSAAGVGALFATPSVFESKYPECSRSLAICTLEKQALVRTCVAGYRDDNKKINYIHDLIAITKESIPSEVPPASKTTDF